MAHPASTPASYVSPLPANSKFEFVSGTMIYNNVSVTDTDGIIVDSYYKIRITRPDGTVAFDQGMQPGSNGVHPDEAQGYTEQNLLPGTYTAYYAFTYPYTIPIGEGSWTIGYKTNTATYTFTVIENKLPLKQWTCTDVINRLLDLAEPIRKGEKPRFRLQGVNDDGTYVAGSQAALFDEILAPEFAFTKQTLRECLQQVGEVVHGEPRLTPKKDGSGKWYFEVSYDLYGQNKPWKQAHRAYVKKSVTQNINTYSTSLDTPAENLVNGNGTITEPYAGGGKTLRTEQMYAQITESNMLIPTQFPIYTVQKLEYLQPQESGFKAWDITPWLFESSIYSSQLSSYDQEYPYSKAYAIMFTQGEKNITQLNFKAEHPVNAVFNNYSILNILRRVTGDSGLDIGEAAATGTSGWNPGGYPQLVFRVTYTPIYQARVGQTKINYKDYPTKAAMIYNQQSNVMDSKAYGENLKGVIARLGNAEKSYTYHLSRLSQIAKPGMMFDEDYTISGVYVEILPAIINCTVALTKNFNRISRYVGISSVKRYSQISQSMAVERNILWNEYIIIGDQEISDYLTTSIGGQFMRALADTFLQSGSYNPLTYVAAYGMSGENNPLPAVGLPVIASAFGNSVSFSWEYEDNYSAGAVSQYRTSGSGQNQVSGYFQNSYQYTDYYGKLYYYHFDLSDAGPAVTADLANELPGLSSMPEDSSEYISTFGYQTNKEPYIVRKDNREKLQCNFQVDFVTNRKNFIIGSALARNFPLVHGTDTSLKAKLYVLPDVLNKFVDQLPESIDLSDLPSANIEIGYAATGSGFFYVESGFTTAGGSLTNVFPGRGKAWAIVTERTTESVEVETETGQTTTQTTVKGGEVLIGQNMDIEPWDPFPTVYFTRKRKIFKEDVWTDIR